MKPSLITPLLESPWLGALETAGQVGLSIGGSFLCGAPFANRTARLVASGVGGAIPMILKNTASEWAPSGDKRAYRERLLNIAELGVGIMTSFLPNMSLLLVSGLLLSFGFEYLHQQFIWDRTTGEAVASALRSAVTGLCLGGFFFLLPRFMRGFQAYGGDEARWARVGRHLESLAERDVPNLRDVAPQIRRHYLEVVRRHTSVATVNWFRSERRILIFRMRRDLAAMARLFHGLEHDLSPARIERASKQWRTTQANLRQHQIELETALEILTSYQNGDGRFVRYDHFVSSFDHEFRNEVSPMFGWADIFFKKRDGQSLGKLLEMSQKRLAYVENLVAFYGRRPPLQESLRLIRQRFGRSEGIEINVAGTLGLRRSEAFDLGVVLRELVRNAERTATSRGIKPRIQIRQVGYDLEVVDNAGGFREVIERASGEAGVGGEGMALIDSVRVHGWEVRRSPAPDGTRFFIGFGKRNQLGPARYIPSGDGYSVVIPGSKQSVVVLGDTGGYRSLSIAGRHKVEFIDRDPDQIYMVGRKVEIEGKNLAAGALDFRPTEGDWYHVRRRADYLEVFYPLSELDIEMGGAHLYDRFVSDALATKLRPGGIGYLLTGSEEIYCGLRAAMEREGRLKLLGALSGNRIPIVGGYAGLPHALETGYSLFFQQLS